jgi:hypothetical protein
MDTDFHVKTDSSHLEGREGDEMLILGLTAASSLCEGGEWHRFRSESSSFCNRGVEASGSTARELVPLAGIKTELCMYKDLLTYKFNLLRDVTRVYERSKFDRSEV